MDEHIFTTALRLHEPISLRRIEPLHGTCCHNHFAMNAKAEVPAAVKMIAGILRDRARATLAGTAPAALPKAEQAAPAVSVPPPPTTQRVFLVRHVKWTDQAGQLRLAPAMHDADLPPAVATRALKSGAALALSDTRRKQLGGSKPPRRPNPDHCESLDADTTSSAAAPVKHSAFEILDRGKPYTLKTAREAAS
jgi:hypothetical protein